MPPSYILWMLAILWLIFGWGYPFLVEAPSRRVERGSNLLLFILLALLGYQVFGSAVK